MSFAVVTDSLAGLPLEEVASRGLVVIPLSYYMNGEEHTCQAPEEYDSAAFFRAMKQRVEVKTSMIPPQRFAEYWEPLLQSELDILFLSASSGISSSYQSATIAARQLEESYPERKIRVVDTLSSTLGEGLLVLRAFALREKGMSLDETADTILSLRPYIAHYFTVDDLLYISRGGRVSGAKALLGTVLGIKPLLKGDEHGHIVMNGKVRGRAASIKALAEKFDKIARYPGDQTVFIAHGDCRQDAETLAKLIQEKNPPKKIITPFDPTNGAHAGPGSLAIFLKATSTPASTKETIKNCRPQRWETAVFAWLIVSCYSSPRRPRTAASSSRLTGRSGPSPFMTPVWAALAQWPSFSLQSGSAWLAAWRRAFSNNV